MTKRIKLGEPFTLYGFASDGKRIRARLAFYVKDERDKPARHTKPDEWGAETFKTKREACDWSARMNLVESERIAEVVS